MHYDEVLSKNCLKIVIYWHDSLVEESSEYSLLSDLEITSIQHCQYVAPHILKDFLTNFRFTLLNKISSYIQHERYYLLTIRFTGYASEIYEVQAIEDVNFDSDPYLTLH